MKSEKLPRRERIVSMFKNLEFKNGKLTENDFKIIKLYGVQSSPFLYFKFDVPAGDFPYEESNRIDDIAKECEENGGGVI